MNSKQKKMALKNKKLEEFEKKREKIIDFLDLNSDASNQGKFGK